MVWMDSLNFNSACSPVASCFNESSIYIKKYIISGKSRKSPLPREKNLKERNQSRDRESLCSSTRLFAPFAPIDHALFLVYVPTIPTFVRRRIRIEAP